MSIDDRPYIEAPKNGNCVTVKELYEVLKAEIEAGRGDGEILFDTEARKANCHLVRIHSAGYQGDVNEPLDPYAPFVLFPAWSSGEFT